MVLVLAEEMLCMVLVPRGNQKLQLGQSPRCDGELDVFLVSEAISQDIAGVETEGQLAFNGSQSVFKCLNSFCVNL